MRDVTKEAKLIMDQPFMLDDEYIPAGTFISLPAAALRMAFQDSTDFRDVMITKVTGKKRGRPRTKEV